jgi:RNA polymerase sigma-70 factor (ECF subfamily)
MASVRDGDVQQLGVLFERHHRPLYDYFVRLTRDRTLSEDLVQEVFLRILRYRHTYRAESEFRFWLYQIARNARADHFRKRRDETELPEDDDFASAAPGPSAALEESQSHALLRAALDRLPEDKREVLVLSRFQHLKYDQIARLLGCSVTAVKVRVHRAMKDLRSAYFELSKDHV